MFPAAVSSSASIAGIHTKHFKRLVAFKTTTTSTATAAAGATHNAPSSAIEGPAEGNACISSFSPPQNKEQPLVKDASSSDAVGSSPLHSSSSSPSSSSWLSVGYCEMLNGQPSFVNGSMLGINTRAVAATATAIHNNNNNNASTLSPPTTSFVYGGIFDSQSVSIEKAPLPPKFVKLLRHYNDAGKKGGGGGGDGLTDDLLDALEREEAKEATMLMNNTSSSRNNGNNSNAPSSGSRGYEDNSSPPPPPQWRCARETAARLDAYLANHKGDLASQQQWLRELNAANKKKNQQTEEENSRNNNDSNNHSIIFDSPHYRDLVSVQLEMKRQRSAFDRVAARAGRGGGGGGRGRGGGAPSLSSPSSSSSSSSSPPPPPPPYPSKDEAVQYLALADREFLMSITRRFQHCQRVYTDTKQRLEAMDAASSATGTPCGGGGASDEGKSDAPNRMVDGGGGGDSVVAAKKEKERETLLEAHRWAKGQLKSILSDGSSGLWFTAAQAPSPSPSPHITATPTATNHHHSNSTSTSNVADISLYSTGNSRAILIRAPLIAAYLLANGIRFGVGGGEKGEGYSSSSSPSSFRHPWLWSTHAALFGYQGYGNARNFGDPHRLPTNVLPPEAFKCRANSDDPKENFSNCANKNKTSSAGGDEKGNVALDLFDECFSRVPLMAFSQTFRIANIKGLTADHTIANELERKRVNMAAMGRSLNNLSEHVSDRVSTVRDVVAADELEVAAPSHGSGNDDSSSSPRLLLSVPILTLQPPALVTRAFGLLRYKLNPNLGPNEQIILPTPAIHDDRGGGSIVGSGIGNSGVGGHTNFSMQCGEVLVLCPRAVFESAASDSVSFAPDGATVDTIVERILEDILEQVEENIVKMKSGKAAMLIAKRKTEEGNNENADETATSASEASPSSSASSPLSCLLSVDANRLASVLCDVGVEHGTRKSMQSMVVITPPLLSPLPLPLSHLAASPSSSDADVEVPTLLANEFITASRTIVADDHAGMNAKKAMPLATLTASVQPSPLFVTNLSRDPLFCAAFCDDLKRHNINLLSYLKMRWLIFEKHFVKRSRRGGGVNSGDCLSPSSGDFNVIRDDCRTTSHFLSTCYSAAGSVFMRLARAEERFFGRGPPTVTVFSSSTTKQGSAKDSNLNARRKVAGVVVPTIDNKEEEGYFRRLATELFGRARANRS